MIGVTENGSPWAAEFDRLEGEPAGGERPWFHALRRRGFERFSSLGFPTSRLEDWRYTPVESIASGSFRAVPAYVPGSATAAQVRAFAWEPWGGSLLVFVDGRYAPDLSRQIPLPEGVRVLPLSTALEPCREAIEPRLGSLAAFEERAFTALNTAFLGDGAFVHVPEGAAVREPIQILYLTTGQAGTVSHPRTLIVAGKGSQLTVLESHAGANGAASFTNAVTEIDAEDGAVVDHCRVQREGPAASHVASLHARLSRDAALTSHVVSLGAALARQDVFVTLDGEGADCTLNGLYVVGGRQHTDHHTFVDHARPRGASRQMYKGVLDGRSRGVFDGRVLVRKDAQKTDARQVNRNLLISDEALVDTKPQLEINADDVKCTHAATIGQIDPDMLFYLRSRGLDLAEARDFLMRAFVSDVSGRIRLESVREGIDRLMIARLGHAEGAEERP